MYDNKWLDDQDNQHDRNHVRGMLSDTNAKQLCVWNNYENRQQHKQWDNNLWQCQCDNGIVGERRLLCEQHGMFGLRWQ